MMATTFLALLVTRSVRTRAGNCGLRGPAPRREALVPPSDADGGRTLTCPRAPGRPPRPRHTADFQAGGALQREAIQDAGIPCSTRTCTPKRRGHGPATDARAALRSPSSCTMTPTSRAVVPVDDFGNLGCPIPSGGRAVSRSPTGRGIFQALDPRAAVKPLTPDQAHAPTNARGQLVSLTHKPPISVTDDHCQRGCSPRRSRLCANATGKDTTDNLRSLTKQLRRSEWSKGRARR